MTGFPHGTSALLTDRYELTMLEAALRDGTAAKKAVFEAFARVNPGGGDWGVMAGSERLVAALAEFVYDNDTLAYLGEFLEPTTIAYLRDFRFTGRVTCFPDGELWLAGEPLVSVEGTFAECVVIETVVLSILNSGIGVASAAARIRQCVGAETTLIEMGSRRIHETAAVDMARAAYIGGFDVTSNLEAGRTYGVPTAGTAAHAWTMAHDDEFEAFVAQLEALGMGTTLLVDTYDIPRGIELAVAAANQLGAAGPGAIRIDSGDLAHEARAARDLLDSLGAVNTKILLSGDLDYASIVQMVDNDVPADAFGVGTKLAAATPPGIVYKLVEIESVGGMRRVVKVSATAAKSCFGGMRRVVRLFDGGAWAGDVVGYVDEDLGEGKDVRVVMFDGVQVVGLDASLETARGRRADGVARWQPGVAVVISAGLAEQIERWQK